MDIQIDKQKLDDLLGKLRTKLLQQAEPSGYWTGQLSGSALSTATAVFALAKTDREEHMILIEKGLDWLGANANEDGGWGDTTNSQTNISTTLLCWSAFTAAKNIGKYRVVISKAESWLSQRAGFLDAEHLVKAVCKKYGKDRTFSVPILTMCALADRLGDSEDAWKWVKPLPFEFALLPHKIFKWLKMDVVSYALPALIAMGQVNFHHRKPKNPVKRLLRKLALNKTLSVLSDIQPDKGGFLEAAPLTSFVVMSLAGCGLRDNIVVRKGVAFLVRSVRSDGSWPIDTNLATWVTTLSLNALAANPRFEGNMPLDKRSSIQNWLLSQQYQDEHPYTHADPGGWAWTSLPGAVPDADDTAGVLIALKNLNMINDNVIASAGKGLGWLMGLQNSDGGIPTFCKGWNRLDFDKSASDLTAHTINAMSRWLDEFGEDYHTRIDASLVKALRFLACDQNRDGYWLPLWFGNQNSIDKTNPVFGTSRVLINLAQLKDVYKDKACNMLLKATAWLISVQNSDGGFGGAQDAPSSIEETAIAVDALSSFCIMGCGDVPDRKAEAIKKAVTFGTNWLMKNIDSDNDLPASPIGLYFAKLWYYEKLYPVIFTVGALEKVSMLCRQK